MDACILPVSENTQRSAAEATPPHCAETSCSGFPELFQNEQRPEHQHDTDWQSQQTGRPGMNQNTRDQVGYARHDGADDSVRQLRGNVVHVVALRTG